MQIRRVKGKGIVNDDYTRGGYSSDSKFDRTIKGKSIIIKFAKLNLAIRNWRYTINLTNVNLTLKIACV